MQCDTGGGWGDASEPLAGTSTSLVTPTQSGEKVTFDLESAIKYPILPPNPNFFCFGERLHITTVAKTLAIFYALLYGFLCFLIYKSDHAAAFMIAVMVVASVGGSSLYATFNWSKLCLIPFLLLQTILVLYVLLCIPVLVYAAVSSHSNYIQEEIAAAPLTRLFNVSTRSWLLMWVLFLVALLAFLLYSALLLFYEYQFIAEVDRFLKSIKKSSSHASRDDQQPDGGGGAGQRWGRDAHRPPPNMQAAL